MTVGDLKEHLYELSENGLINEDTEIRLAEQPRWAFEYATGANVAVVEQDDGEHVLYLEEGHQISYLNEKAAEQLGW